MAKIIIQKKYGMSEGYLYPVETDGENIAEQTGYRSVKEIVEGMLMAGQRLEDYRDGLLDNYDEENEDQYTSSPYEKDPVDLANDSVYVQRAKRQREAAKKAAEETEKKPTESNEKAPAGADENVTNSKDDGASANKAVSNDK